MIFNVADSVVTFAASSSQEYSGYMIIKTHIPRMGSKFVPDEFRINSLCMSFYNHITTVFLAQRGSCFDKTVCYIASMPPSSQLENSHARPLPR